MKCPLQLAGAFAGQSDWQAVNVECDREECAWWDDTLKLCSVRVIAQFTVGASVYLHNLSEIMSTQVQL